MSVENIKESGNNLPDVKKILEKKDIEWALAWLLDNSKKVIELKKEELAWCFEVAQFSMNLEKDELSRLEDILKKYLQPKI